jgi:succinate-semialdehyde dehydrogenase/glutarate-semialdehyde dehydrogenase
MAAGQQGGRRARLLIDGSWVDGPSTYPVFDKFSKETIGEADAASMEQVDAAVRSAQCSFETTKLDPYRRYEILLRVAQLIEGRRDELVETIIAEAGFPLVDASREVTRAAQTFILSAEEGKRLIGEGVPIEASPGNVDRMAFTIRVPRGVVCGITSFNSPLNMVAHKVAPALAAGNTVVIKPARMTPFSAAILFEIMLEAGMPPKHIQLVQGDGAAVGGQLTRNQQIAFYTFTGSTGVGKGLREGIGLRPCALELGSIAATIVCDDADLERAAPRIAHAGFRRAGQACTSTQRLFVHEDVLERFTGLLVEAIEKLPVGDPHHSQTIVGPMISEAEAQRAESWVNDAVAQGARIVLGGKRTGAVLYPTVLTDVRPEMRVLSEEIFAPVLSIIPFRSFERMIDEVNSTEFGLAAGIFTQDVMRAMQAARRLHVGIVHINEASSSRVDLMPFSGVKQSGLGREGPKYAMQELTEERLITISLS